MKNGIAIWSGIVLVLVTLTSACGANSASEKSTAVPEQAASVEVKAASGLRTGDLAPDFTLPDSRGNMVNLADQLEEKSQVVLVFYYGYLCPPCMAQLSEIESNRAKYEERGAQVIAVAIQTASGAETSAERSGAQYPILADGDHAVADAYGVNDAGFSTPSVFVISRDRHIVWSHISVIEKNEGCGKDRVPSQTILENLPGEA